MFLFTCQFSSFSWTTYDEAFKQNCSCFHCIQACYISHRSDKKQRANYDPVSCAPMCLPCRPVHLEIFMLFVACVYDDTDKKQKKLAGVKNWSPTGYGQGRGAFLRKSGEKFCSVHENYWRNSLTGSTQLNSLLGCVLEHFEKEWVSESTAAIFMTVED